MINIRSYACMHLSYCRFKANPSYLRNLIDGIKFFMRSFHRDDNDDDDAFARKSYKLIILSRSFCVWIN